MASALIFVSADRTAPHRTGGNKVAVTTVALLLRKHVGLGVAVAVSKISFYLQHGFLPDLVSGAPLRLP